ncbi:MAG: type II secretion system F family protein [Candidatus Nanohaloarchaea archaeon]
MDLDTEKFLLPVAQKSMKVVPQLERDLMTARIDQEPEEYLSEAISKSLKVGIPSGLSLIFAGYNIQNQSMILIGIAALPLLTLMAFLTFANYPKIQTNKRTRKLEKDLPYALRDMLIEVKSGIALYDAMKTVTEGYGEASKEFQRIIKDIDGGKSMVKALEESIVRNPSEKYRRALWQLNNSIKSGTDISIALESIVDSIIKKQKLEIKKYGKELNPYILVYLLIAVIGPSLGITGLIVISSFTGTKVGKTTYLGILGGMIVFQAFFLNLIKSKRPEVKA